jgi:hypothetical protein
MKNIQKKLRNGMWVGTVCLLAFLVASCVKTNNTTQPAPLTALDVINASPDAGPVDFYLSATEITRSPLSLGEFTNYFNAYAGQNTAIFYQTGTRNIIGQTTVNLAANTYYSLFLTNVKATPDLVLVKDSVLKPAAGSTVLRFANMSPNAPNVDLVVKGGNTLATNIGYKTVTGFFDFPLPKTIGLDTLQIVQTGTHTVLATVPTTTYQDNGDYTIWLYGLANTNVSGEGLQAGVMENLYFTL